MASDTRTQLEVALAEDNSDHRQLMVDLLEQLGYRVVVAVSNGEELLASCASTHVDVVLADLDMPVVDGLEAAEKLADQGIPVILISGYADAEELVLEREPIAARLSKPASAEAIRSAIETAFQNGAPKKPR